MGTMASNMTEKGVPRVGGSWSWGQRARTRIAELETLCELMARRPNAAADAAALAERAREYLARARNAVDRKRPLGRWSGTSIDAAETSMNAAECLVLRYMPPEELEGRLPELTALVQEHLPSQDPRRLEFEELRRTRAETPLCEQERETIITAAHAALAAHEHEYIRVRSFRNIVHGLTLCLTVLAITFAVFMAYNPRLMPICFQHDEPRSGRGQLVCPTRVEEYTRTQDVDATLEKVTSRWDYVLIEMLGLIAAAVAAAASLRQSHGTSAPYSIPLALAILKLPTGALTAVLGLLLLRGNFIPGLSALDTPGQIMAWAVVFGYAQQLFTRLVDAHAQDIINSVGRPEAPKPPSR